MVLRGVHHRLLAGFSPACEGNSCANTQLVGSAGRGKHLVCPYTRVTGDHNNKHVTPLHNTPAGSINDIITGVEQQVIG